MGPLLYACCRAIARPECARQIPHLTLRRGRDRRSRGADRAGQCVAVPTETVYGLAADATDSAAVAGIYAAKGRPLFNPLIVHVPDLAAAERIAVFDDAARDLATRFWPGPLTLVAAAARRCGHRFAGDRRARDDRHPRARAPRDAGAARGYGKPLAAPSANASGAISPTRAEHVAASLAGRIPLVIDDGATPAGLESTIVMDGQVLRPGPLTAAELGACPKPRPGAGRDHRAGTARQPLCAGQAAAARRAVRARR
jgi:L-threonylcarbamoyladenylate synthase